jgi:probable HAF family extracellular repeat protein
MRRALYALAGTLIALTSCTSKDTPTEPGPTAEDQIAGATAAPTWVVIGLGGLPRQQVGGTAEDINDLGHVVGTTTGTAGNPRAFLWKNGVMRSLGTLGGAYSTAAAINNAGQVVGASARGDGKPRAYIWANGTMTGLGTLGGSRSEATDINAQGDVVGWSYLTGDPKTNPDADGPIAHGFLWRNGKMIDLGTLGGVDSRAEGINDKGHVVGISRNKDGWIRAFLWKDGVMRDIGGADTSAPFVTGLAVNWSGVVVGMGYVRRLVVAYSWTNGLSQMLPLDNGFGSLANDVNDAGRIVGGVDPLEQQRQAFTFKAGITTILPPLPNGRTAEALGINKDGDIVGWSDGAGTPFGALQPVLWRKQ